jgi:hypothetical protein
MTGKHTIFDTRRQSDDDTRNISPSPERPDDSSVPAAFLAQIDKPFDLNQPQP